MKAQLFNAKGLHIKLLYLFVITIFSHPVLAEIYQWVDADGNTHFGDKAPENSNSKRVELKLDPVAAPTEIKTTTEEDKYDRYIEELEKQIAADKLVEQEIAEKKTKERLKKCTDGREQLAVLQQDIPIYRTDKGELRAAWYGDTFKGQRHYLDEAMKSTNTDKAIELVAINCENPSDLDEQTKAYDNWSNTQYCDQAKANLAKAQHPSKRTPEQDIKVHQKKVSEYCG